MMQRRWKHGCIDFSAYPGTDFLREVTNMKKSIINVVRVNGRYETQGYIYERHLTPNGFIILRHSKAWPLAYPCVVYKGQ